MVGFNGLMSGYRGRYGQIAGGGMRSDSKQPNQKFDRGNEASAVGFYQDSMREGVQGFGNMLASDFRKQIGQTLGNLNAIGGLRSGALPSAINDAMDQYGRRVGDYAAMATERGAELGMRTVEGELGRQERNEDRRLERRKSTMQGIGQLLGAGLGYFKG